MMDAAQVFTIDKYSRPQKDGPKGDVIKYEKWRSDPKQNRQICTVFEFSAFSSTVKATSGLVTAIQDGRYVQHERAVRIRMLYTNRVGKTDVTECGREWPAWTVVVEGDHTKSGFPVLPEDFDDWFLSWTKRAGVKVVADWRAEARRSGSEAEWHWVEAHKMAKALRAAAAQTASADDTPADRFVDNGEPEQPKRDDPKPRAPSGLVNASDLKDMKFAPISYVIPGYIAEGCSLMAGAPKLGKSWMVMDMAIAKATGGTCLGSVKTPEPEDVLYLALEDNLRRLQSRMDKLMPFGGAWPERLTFATTWPRANEGGIDKIREWAKSRKRPRLVVIDVLTAFRPPVSPKDNAYTADYNAIKVLTELAAELGVAVVVVHHTRKSRDQVDPFDRVSGTLGLSGAADTALILDRDGNGVTLYGRGRDIPEIETAVQFNKDLCRWSVMGRATEVHQSDVRKAVTDVLLVTREPMSPVTIAEATGQSRGSIKTLLFRMHSKGDVLKTTKGSYIHPSRTDLQTPPDVYPL